MTSLLTAVVGASRVMLSYVHMPQIDVAMDETNTQIITIKSDVEAGRLLLHWGVEGGKDYKGGWRLPDHSCRPDGTQQYKDRALQTPFRCVWVWLGGGETA